jgi:hypothetical protein
MTDHGRKPIRWANDLNTLLAAVAAATAQPRFPVRIADLALEISRSRFPDSPIIAVEGRSLGDFEGALYPMPDRKGWAILYNKDLSPGRKHLRIRPRPHAPPALSSGHPVLRGKRNLPRWPGARSRG